MSAPDLATIFAPLKAGRDRWTLEIPSTWMQGRTAYGGLSSALTHHCARLAVPDVPPLRSAQVAFVGPLAGAVEVSCELLRRGKNTAFVAARIASAAGVGFTATYVFMDPRESAIAHENIPAPDIGPPPADDATRHGPPEFFTHNLDYPEKRLDLGANRPTLLNWHRLRGRDGVDPFTELLCVGDGLPPSAMGLMDKNAMVSSMNWQVNMLTDAPETENGWWLLGSTTHHARHGASSQYMTVWNSRREPVMTGMQSVALFV